MPSLSLEALALFPLEESATLLKYTLRAAQAGSWVWDVVSDQCFWSEEFHSLVGTDPATSRPSSEAWLLTIHCDDREAALREMTASLRERRELNNEFRVVRPDGVVRWMRSQGHALYDKDGTPLRMMGVMFDITERKQTEAALRESEERLRLATQAAAVGIWSWNIATNEVFWTPECHAIMGVTGFGGALEDFSRWVHPDDAGKVWAAVQEAIDHRRPYLAEFRIVRPDGELRWLLNQGLVEYEDSGQPRRLLGIVMDITQRKQIVEQLRESDRHKDEFLAVLAHELRNPLASIRNAVHVMHRLGIQDPQLQRMCDLMNRQTDQLCRLVDDLLDISRIGQGKTLVSKERLDLRTIVERAVEVSRPAIDGSRHRLEVSLPSTPLMLDGDEVRLVQVVSNLLNNAAKYTEPEGSLRLTVDAQGGEARIQVEDNGIGMSAEFLPVVFDLFAQADRTSDRARGGLGIGLALVRRLVELHGGTVHADSAGLGCGSVFTVRLPLAPG
jgi:PAS domain S-box-containing protein